MKRFYFHCSEINYNHIWEPRLRIPKIKANNEPDTPRLCVGPTINSCFVSRLFTKEVFVYRTIKPYNGIQPKDVWDQVITQERWLIPPVKLELIKTIDKELVLEINELPIEICKIQKKSTARTRACQYAIVNKYLAPTKKDLRIEKLLLEFFGISDPELFLIKVYLDAA